MFWARFLESFGVEVPRESGRLQKDATGIMEIEENVEIPMSFESI